MKKIDKKNKVSAIVQARLTSTRLPGKVLMDIEGKPMLWHVVNRLKFSKKIDDIILAIPDTKENNSLEDYCKKNNLKYFRGDELNVLKRYYNTAKKYQAKTIVRITADCPLLDPEIVDMVVEKHIASGADYTSNVINKTFPKGLDVEIFQFEALEKSHKDAKDAYDREHVTSYMYKNPNIFKLQNIEASLQIGFPELRLTVDTKEDIDFVRKIYENLYRDGQIFGAKEVICHINQKNEQIITKKS